MTPETEPVLTEQRDGVLLVTLNRPDALNAVNSALGEGLLAAARRLDADDSLAVAVLTGAGRAFCSGMDLKAFAAEGEPRGIEEFVHRGTAKPMIAAIEGYAVAAGLEIALTCDLMVAGEGARLGLPEARVGLFAGGGGLLRLGRRVPYSVAMTMALTGEPISAPEAARYGLVSQLAPDGAALPAALALAGRIAASSPLGVRYSKQLLRETQGRTEAEFWAYQRPLLRQVLDSADAREGAVAFAERRPPRWTGR